MASTDVTRRPTADGGGSPALPWEHWWRSVPPWALPVLLAAIQVGGAALTELPLGTVLPTAGPGLPVLLGLTLLVVGPVALLWRHRHPLLTLTVALAATYGYLILGYPRGPYFLAAFAATAAERPDNAGVRLPGRPIG